MVADAASVQEKLLGAIPPSRKILELGCGEGRLGAAWKSANPGGIWHGTVASELDVSVACSRLDKVMRVDLEAFDPATVDADYDCIVIPDALPCLVNPTGLLEKLLRVIASGATLVACLPNMAHLSSLERFVFGDFSYDQRGLLDSRHLRFFSPASAIKMFLDSGWLPNLADALFDRSGSPATATAFVEAAAVLGVPAAKSDALFGLQEMIFTGRPAPRATPGGRVSLSVIVPVNHELQFDLNAARSPGFMEIGAEVIAIRGALSAADAFEAGRRAAHGEWLLYCHQDAYFPKGAGFALAEHLSRHAVLPSEDILIGLVGLAVSAGDEKPAPVGLVVDRTILADWPATDRAASFDEFAMIVHRDTPLNLDPALGWHLWATDLCMAAQLRTPPIPPRVIRVPCFHNSLSTYALPEAFHKSAAVLAAKYPHLRRLDSNSVVAMGVPPSRPA